MTEERHFSGPFLTVDLIRKSTSNPVDDLLSPEAPSIASAKRRKSKLFSNRRTNEEMIKETHEQLMKYVDTVEGKVQAIVEAHEGEFLQAYRIHVKKVRDEMETLRKQSSRNANSEQVHLERIDALEKQLTIFREESLKLFEKVVARDKEIAELNIKLKEVQADNAECRKSLHLLARRNKDLETALLKLQSKEQNQNGNAASRKQGIELSQQRRTSLYSPYSKQLFPDDKLNAMEKRPFTSAYDTNNKTFSLRVQSNQKLIQPLQLQELREKLQEQSGSAKLVSVDTVIKLLSQPQQQSNGKRSLANYRVTREKINLKAACRRSSSFRKDSLIQLKSQELAERMDYLSIFKKCVGEIKKDIMRRNNIPSLNFFKENGPKDFIEFKKVENYLLLELFLKDENVLKKFHELLFKGTE